MIIHFDCKNCDEPVQEHCADCYACFNGDSGHGLDCPQKQESIDYDQLMIDQGIIPNDMLDY
tara:strand:- start:275 stop:460 length:186 start_codon:yes stop_codon:yes gene_type:complete